LILLLPLLKQCWLLVVTDQLAIRIGDTKEADDAAMNELFKIFGVKS
jgi:hypothetical protein